MDAVGSNKATDCCERLKAMSNQVLCRVGVSRESYIIRPAGFQGLCIRGGGGQEGGGGREVRIRRRDKIPTCKGRNGYQFFFLPVRRKNEEIAVSRYLFR